MRERAFISTENLTKIYRKGGEEIRAVDGVSLSFDKGEFAAIYGTSGAGKSTLLYLIGGLGRPTSGRVTIGGVDLATLDDDTLADFRRQRIGFIFQFFYLIPTLTVLENVMVPLIPLSMPHREKVRRAEEAMERAAISHRREHLPGELSGGEQQRAVIARALVMDPEIILADEPTSDLDRKTAEAIISLFQDLNKRGKTIIVATHDMRILDRVPRRIGMEDGRIVSDERG
ncbi:MAG TPA: ABC transporter ATP-binding protein [Armatimonadetes bacterium]|nr:ABC transporter ATP-binding protein [Armatimonadota bacterium]